MSHNRYSANSKENDLIENLLQQLEKKDSELVEAFEEQESFAKIREIEIQYVELAKKINAISDELNLDLNVKEFYTDREVDTARAKFFTEYRSKVDQTRVDDTKPSEDSIQITPILSQNKQVKFAIKAPKLVYDPTKPLEFQKSFIHSTPFKLSDSITADGEEITVKQQLESVITELSKEFEADKVQSFFENKDNLEFIDRTLKEEADEKNIFTRLKDRIIATVAPLFEKKDPSNVTLNNSGEDYASAINNFSQNFDTSDSDNMSDPLAIRGLSVKDALDLIPRFNGANIPLSQFLDGCMEAKNVIPANLEKEFVRLIRIRLYGEALNIARTQSFDNLKALSDFFEKMFGSAKTYYDLMGELAKVRQESSESVVIYLNRLKDIEKEIRKAAQKEQRITNENAFTADLNKDCLKYFMRGLRWEIKARMGTPVDYQKAQEEAIETEREFACSVFDDPTPRKIDDKEKFSKETRKINLVGVSNSPIECAYCKQSGHVVTNCYAFARSLAQSNPQFNSTAYSNPRVNFNRNQQRPNLNFGGWNAGNRQRVGFLPQQGNFNPNRNNFYPNRNNFNTNRNNFNANRNNFNANRNNFNAPRNFNNTNGQNGRSFYNNNPYYQNQRGNPPNNPGNIRRENFNANVQGNGFIRRDGPNNNISCYYCGKAGHMQRNCNQYQREMSQSNANQGNATALSQMGARGELRQDVRPLPPKMTEKNAPPPATTSRA